jgi:hypothetical protein
MSQKFKDVLSPKQAKIETLLPALSVILLPRLWRSRILQAKSLRTQTSIRSTQQSRRGSHPITEWWNWLSMVCHPMRNLDISNKFQALNTSLRPQLIRIKFVMFALASVKLRSAWARAKISRLLSSNLRMQVYLFMRTSWLLKRSPTSPISNP